MAEPVETREPEPCEKCGAAMDVAPLPEAAGWGEAGTRLICPRCNHETTQPH